MSACALSDSLMGEKNVHHGTQVVKVHNQNEIIRLIVVLSVNNIKTIFSY